MHEVVRTEWQWAAINQALQVGPDGLSIDMYQAASVAQVLTDKSPQAWPAGTIKGQEYADYMRFGARAEYSEMFDWDKVDQNYSRAARFFLPADEPYPYDTEGALRRNVSEYGDLGFYIANNLALYGISLADALHTGDGQSDVSLRTIDDMARQQALASQVDWYRPAFQLVLGASYFFQALKSIDAGKEGQSVQEFFARRDRLARTAGDLVMAMSVFVQAKFGLGIADVFYRGLKKIERRAETNTTLNGSGDEREMEIAAT